MERTPTWRAGRRLLRARLVTLAVMGAAMMAGMAASSASAYEHAWSCDAASAVQCYDNTGQQYNNWIAIFASMSATSSEICAKGITAAGNVRTPLGCQTNTNAAGTCFVSSGGSSPATWAYVYWAGPGTTRQINGRANTLSC